MKVLANFIFVIFIYSIFVQDTLGNANCGFHEISCGDTSSQCYRIERKCDGTKNCTNGFDEQNCDNLTCPFFWTTCGDGSCYYIGFGCNGVRNCRNGFDEQKCTADRKCPRDYLPCGDGQCYFINKRCDNNNDCRNRADEQNCRGDLPCPTNWVNCGDGQCYHRLWRCDNITHCKNRRDEAHCVFTTARPTARVITTTPITVSNPVTTITTSTQATVSTTSKLPRTTTSGVTETSVRFPVSTLAQGDGVDSNPQNTSILQILIPVVVVLVIAVVVGVGIACYFRRKAARCASTKMQAINYNTNTYLSAPSTNERHSYQGLVNQAEYENGISTAGHNEHDQYDYVQSRRVDLSGDRGGYSTTRENYSTTESKEPDYTNNTISRNTPSFDVDGYVASI